MRDVTDVVQKIEDEFLSRGRIASSMFVHSETGTATATVAKMGASSQQCTWKAKVWRTGVVAAWLSGCSSGSCRSAESKAARKNRPKTKHKKKYNKLGTRGHGHPRAEGAEPHGHGEPRSRCSWREEPGDASVWREQSSWSAPDSWTQSTWSHSSWTRQTWSPQATRGHGSPSSSSRANVRPDHVPRRP